MKIDDENGGGDDDDDYGEAGIEQPLEEGDQQLLFDKPKHVNLTSSVTPFSRLNEIVLNSNSATQHCASDQMVQIGILPKSDQDLAASMTGDQNATNCLNCDAQDSNQAARLDSSNILKLTGQLTPTMDLFSVGLVVNTLNMLICLLSLILIV